MKTHPFFLILLLISVSTVAQDLVITEIMYNSPGEDVEFIEFYNCSATPLDLSGYEVIDGIDYTFSALTLEANSTYVITNDSLKFQAFYGQVATEWTNGGLNNGGESIVVVNPSKDTIISFEYSDNEPWSKAADGGGASLVLCDLSSDPNAAGSWERSQPAISALIEEGVFVSATPGSYNGCPMQGEQVLVPEFVGTRVLEKSGTLVIDFFMDNPSDSNNIYLVDLTANTTAENGVDFIILNDTLEFAAGINSVQTVEIEIIDNSEINDDKQIHLQMRSLATNSIVSESSALINIQDDDGPTTGKLQLRGVIHSSIVKVIELYAVEDISATESLNFGLSSANNGGGSSGLEYQLQAFSASAGDCIFVTNDTLRIKQFFDSNDQVILLQDEELEADYNGDDAIELYENCKIIDVFGFAEIDGTGESWEYSRGWTKRKTAFAFNTTMFNPEEWTYSGSANFDGITSNADAEAPYPLSCELPPSATDDQILSSVTIYPNPSKGHIWLTSDDIIRKVRVYDVVGQVIFSSDELANKYSIDLSGLSNRLVFVNYEQKGQQFMEKVVLTR